MWMWENYGLGVFRKYKFSFPEPPLEQSYLPYNFGSAKAKLPVLTVHLFVSSSM